MTLVKATRLKSNLKIKLQPILVPAMINSALFEITSFTYILGETVLVDNTLTLSKLFNSVLNSVMISLHSTHQISCQWKHWKAGYS